jgi:hypothetical protein
VLKPTSTAAGSLVIGTIKKEDGPSCTITVASSVPAFIHG